MKNKVNSLTIFLWLAVFLISYTCLLLPIPAHAAAPCDVANPVLPCEVSGTVYDTFAGNYSQNRAFYRTNSFDTSISNGYLGLTLIDNLPHSEGYAFVANYTGATVWTSPSPYNTNFAIFGQFNNANVQIANNFEWIGVGAQQPIADIPTDHYEKLMTGYYKNQLLPPMFVSSYDLAFTNGQLLVDLDIKLFGYDPGDALKDKWEKGIEDTWSNKYNIIDGVYSYPLLFNVDFVNDNEDYGVLVHSGTGQVNMTNWYTDLSGLNWSNDYQGISAAHEAGHMFGIYDEYADGTLDPVTHFTTNDHALMSDLGPVQERYFNDILLWLEGKSGNDLSLLMNSNLPDNPYPPITGFNDGPPGQPVPTPEPSTILLLGLGLIGLVGIRRSVNK